MRGEKKVIKITLAAFLIMLLLVVASYHATAMPIYRTGCIPILPPPNEKKTIDHQPKIHHTTTIYLTESDNNVNITIFLGDKINLTLKDYGDGGYQWIIEQYDPSIIRFETSSNWGASGIPGDFGKDTWIFKTVGTGSTILKLRCYQPWSGGDPGWVFKVFITVI